MKLILDLDTGIDDTFALAYALASPDAELLGVTGTFGNVTRDRGVENDLSLLALFGREDVPVFAGVDRPLASTRLFAVSEDSARFHGANGLGNASLPAGAAHARGAEPQGAAEFIADAVHAYGPDELTVVPTGALTTIATVLSDHPELAPRMRIVLMGGALAQPGNVTPFAEANIYADPEAAAIVFSSGADVTMVGLDVTTQARLSREQAARFGRTGTATGRFLSEMLDYYIGVTATDEVDPAPRCYLHDPLAVAVALDPSLVGTFDIDIRVDRAGAGRGRTIGDPSRVTAPSGRTHAALTLDRARFIERFEERVISFVETCR